YPMLGITKELNLQFVLGYTQDEFVATLGHIANGAIPTTPLITGHVGVGGVAQAFDELGSPERHAQILVHPERRAPPRDRAEVASELLEVVGSPGWARTSDFLIQSDRAPCWPRRSSTATRSPDSPGGAASAESSTLDSSPSSD